MSIPVRVLQLLVVAAIGASVLGVWAGSASGSPAALVGVQDDAWLGSGSGSLESRLDVLDRMGVDIVRFTVRWDAVATRKPSSPSDPLDRAYNWRSADAVLRGLHRHGIEALVTLLGTPGWANGGRAPNWAPTSGQEFGSFARAAATRYSWVRRWTIWNEPNKAQWLRPTLASVYVQRLLNPAYVQIHAANPGALVGGGVTAPRGGSGGVSPVSWITAMGRAGARLDAYAHHPYPSRPQSETPSGPACASCGSITMADLDRLVGLVRKTFGPKRIWLTEFAYQTKPPDLFLGVPPLTQAAYYASAIRRVRLATYVDMLIFFLVRDDTDDSGWQSGFYTAAGVAKPAYTALRLPLIQVARHGNRVELWGQIRTGEGRQQYRIRIRTGGAWGWLGGVRSTDAGGVLSLTVTAPKGALLKLWSVGDQAYGLDLRV